MFTVTLFRRNFYAIQRMFYLRLDYLFGKGRSFRWGRTPTEQPYAQKNNNHQHVFDACDITRTRYKVLLLACPVVSEPCDITPCQNGGFCTQNAVDSHCTCKPGYTGSVCETVVASKVFRNRLLI